MEYIIKEINYDNLDFKSLCLKLDEFQNDIVPERASLGFSSLAGLEKLQKILLMYDKDKAIATAALKAIDGTIGEIVRVYTDEEYRGKGLAKILINKIIEFAKELGYKKLILDVWEYNLSARAVYKKLGFVEIPISNVNPEILKKSFSTAIDENKLKKINGSIIFMEIDI